MMDYPSRDVRQEAGDIGLNRGGKICRRKVELGFGSINIVLKALRLDDIAQEELIKREEQRPKN